MLITAEQKALAIKNQSVAFLLNAGVVYDTKNMTEEDIFGSGSIRNMPEKITGSQMGVVMNLSSFTTPYELWSEKIGAKEIVIEDKEIFKAGHAAEDFVANMFARKLKEEYGENLDSVDIINDTNMYQSKKYPWAIGQPDRFAIITFKSGKIVLTGLECKTTYNSSAKSRWKELSFPCPTSYEESGELQCPATYDCQCRQYEMTTGLDNWYICCCWGFTINECAIALVKRNPEKENLINEAALTFIDCCLKKIEPVTCEENDSAMAEYLNRTYDLANADKVDADNTYSSIMEDVKKYNLLSIELKKKTAEADALSKKIAADLLEKSAGKGNYFSYADDEVSIGIKLTIPHYSNSIDVDKIKKECPEIYAKMSEIGINKVSKTDLEKIEIDGGKKFNAEPYVVEGGINTSKAITVSKVVIKEI